MMRSNKLNSDKHLLHHLLKSNIDQHWETLWNEFVSIDRQGTGSVSRKDFKVRETVQTSLLEQNPLYHKKDGDLFLYPPSLSWRCLAMSCSQAVFKRPVRC